MKKLNWILTAVFAVLLMPGCQNEILNSNVTPPSKNEVAKKSHAPAKYGSEQTMTDEVLYYSDVQNMPGLTIYNAPSTYTFSITAGTGAGQWDYADAKLVYNSYSQDFSELYIFEDHEAYMMANCDKKYDTKTVGTETWTVCEAAGSTCKISGNCIIKCENPTF